MNKNILSDDTLDGMSAEDKAAQLYLRFEKSDFLYRHENQLYRCKKKSNGGFKIKELCTAYPEFIKSVNNGDDKQPNWHYLFKVHSSLDKSLDKEILMSPKDLTSVYRFKSSLLRVFGALFTGTKDDFDIFIRAIFFHDDLPDE